MYRYMECARSCTIIYNGNKLIAPFVFDFICSNLSVHVGRCLQPFYRDKRWTTTWKIQPSTIQKINCRFDWHLINAFVFGLFTKTVQLLIVHKQWILKMLLMSNKNKTECNIIIKSTNRPSLFHFFYFIEKWTFVVHRHHILSVNFNLIKLFMPLLM